MNTCTQEQRWKKADVSGYERGLASVGYMPLVASGTYYMHVCDGCQQAR